MEAFKSSIICSTAVGKVLIDTNNFTIVYNLPSSS